MKQKTVVFLISLLSLALLLGAAGGAAVSLAIGQTMTGETQALTAATAFTYQGRLDAGDGPVTGAYDFEFRLYAAASGDDQVGPAVSHNGVDLSDGLFTVLLDFGAAAFTGQARYKDETVRGRRRGG